MIVNTFENNSLIILKLLPIKRGKNLFINCMEQKLFSILKLHLGCTPRKYIFLKKSNYLIFLMLSTIIS